MTVSSSTMLSTMIPPPQIPQREDSAATVATSSATNLSIVGSQHSQSHSHSHGASHPATTSNSIGGVDSHTSLNPNSKKMMMMASSNTTGSINTHHNHNQNDDFDVLYKPVNDTIINNNVNDSTVESNENGPSAVTTNHSSNNPQHQQYQQGEEFRQPYEQQEQQLMPINGGGGRGGMTRSQTVQSLLSASSTSSSNDSSTFPPTHPQHPQPQPQHLLGQQQQQQTDAVVDDGETCVNQSPHDSNRSVDYSLPSVTSIASSIRADFTTFGMDVRRHTNGSPDVPIIDRGMRNVLEPHIRKARIMREHARSYDHYTTRSSSSSASGSASSSTATTPTNTPATAAVGASTTASTTLSRTMVHESIASSVGVPYVRLRTERPFLFDVYSYPLHEVLAEILGVNDLSQLHNVRNPNSSSNVTSTSTSKQQDMPNLDTTRGTGEISGEQVPRLDPRDTDDPLENIMAPLKTRNGSRKFQESYDNFVTSFCIPLLHSLAMKENLFHGSNTNSSVSLNLHHSTVGGQSMQSSSTRVNYRYQAFPRIRIVRPGDASHGPVCDTALGHSIGYLRFHVPLTPSFGTNSLYTESYPGREDWHPLSAKSVGLGYVFDGARCIHFNVENTTDSTLVALDFVVAMYSEDDSSLVFDDDTMTLGMSSTTSTVTRPPTSFFRYAGGDELCHPRLLEDHFSLSGPGYYDEAVIDVRLGSPSWQNVVAKKRRGKLFNPDERVGFPFSAP